MTHLHMQGATCQTPCVCNRCFQMQSLLLRWLWWWAARKRGHALVLSPSEVCAGSM